MNAVVIHLAVQAVPPTAVIALLYFNRFRSSILNSEDAMHILAPLSGKIGTNLGINGFGVSDDGKES